MPYCNLVGQRTKQTLKSYATNTTSYLEFVLQKSQRMLCISAQLPFLAFLAHCLRLQHHWAAGRVTPRDFLLQLNVSPQEIFKYSSMPSARVLYSRGILFPIHLCLSQVVHTNDIRCKFICSAKSLSKRL